MNFTLTGSALANHLKPLATPVRQHEGRDYDRIGLAVVKDEQEGKLFLDAHVVQPTYEAFMHLNLSGMDEVVDEDHNVVSAGEKALDACAVACAENEHFTMQASVLHRINRLLGTHEGTYVVTQTGGLEVSAGNAANFRYAAKRVMSDIGIPRSTLQAVSTADAMSGTLFNPMGYFDGLSLKDALASAAQICRISGNKGKLQTQVVHLKLSREQMAVEAVSEQGAVCYSSTDALTFIAKDVVSEPLHLAMTLAASEALLSMCSIVGDKIYWMYESQDKVLWLHGGSYSMVIATEEVSRCRFPSFASTHDDMHVKRDELAKALMRAKSSGASKVQLRLDSQEEMEVSTPDGEFSAMVSVGMESFTGDALYDTFPLGTLIAAVRCFGSSQIVLNNCGFLVLCGCEKVSCVVYPV